MADHSGRMLVRMPPALHAQLLALAAEQGVSLNHLVVALLAGGVGFTLEKDLPLTRKCSSCGGKARWHDEAYVCERCGDEWYLETT